MSLDYKILNKKPTIERNGVEYKDLLAQTLDPSVPITGSFLVVNKYYVARPDLISLAVYGDEQYADVLCKVNGISNPFELNENDIIILPHVETVMYMTNVNVDASVMINDKNVQDLASAHSENNLQREYTSLRSPNEQVRGMRNLIVDEENGLLLY